MTSSDKTIIAAFLAGAFLLGCGGGPGATGTATEKDAQPGREPARPGGPRVEGLLGNIPTHEVERVFERNLNKLGDCYALALDAADVIAGSLEFALTVGGDGAVTQAFLKSSDLGSVEAEECMVHAVWRLRFLQPRGGDRAEVSYSMSIDPPGGPLPVVAWGADHLASVIDEQREAVDGCLAGASGIRLTIYAGHGGRVLSAGASSDTFDATEAARCLARAAMSWTLPDPGRGTAKAIVEF